MPVLHRPVETAVIADIRSDFHQPDGGAVLQFEDETTPRELRAGDHVLIAPHRRHRVTWTDPDRPTVWPAVHYT